MEHVLRSCVIGLRLGAAVGLSEAEREVVFYTALLAWVGCHADSHELATWFGDDIFFRAESMAVDRTGLPLLAFVFGHLGEGSPVSRRVRLAGSFMVGGRKAMIESLQSHCLVTADLAGRLGLGAGLAESVQQVFERWDGRGWPAGIGGEQLRISTRIVQLAHAVEVCHRASGVQGAIEVARRRRGTQFDPTLVDVFCRNASELLGSAVGATSWDQVIEAEPGLCPLMTVEELDQALEAIADFVDLKSPYTTGHSRGVADLAAEGGRLCGLSVAECAHLRQAALVHDLGRLGVSNAVWERPGPLGPAELEKVRLHPYLTERILARPDTLHQLGSLAALHHEHLDGSGYPHGLSAGALAPSARLLAAADSYHAMTEPRPHRPALRDSQAADELRAEVRAGRLDGQAVDAVLAAAGHRIRRCRQWPCGLTAREVEVLVLVAQGYSSGEVARSLYISPKTVRNHIEHLYTKIGVSSRAGASLFAMRHGLVGALPEAEK